MLGRAFANNEICLFASCGEVSPARGKAHQRITDRGGARKCFAVNDPNDFSRGDSNHTIEILTRLARIETKVDSLARQPAEKDFYSVTEFATLVDRDSFTVREWCRNGRINAEKRRCGRGNAREWNISHPELLRYRNEGLLKPK